MVRGHVQVLKNNEVVAEGPNLVLNGGLKAFAIMFCQGPILEPPASGSSASNFEVDELVLGDSDSNVVVSQGWAQGNTVLQGAANWTSDTVTVAHTTPGQLVYTFNYTSYQGTTNPVIAEFVLSNAWCRILQSFGLPLEAVARFVTDPFTLEYDADILVNWILSFNENLNA